MHRMLLFTGLVASATGCSKQPVEVRTTDPDTKFTATGDSAGVAIVSQAHPALPPDEAELVRQLKDNYGNGVDFKVLKFNRGPVTLTHSDGGRFETDAQAEVEMTALTGSKAGRTVKRTWVRHVSGVGDVPRGKWLVL